MKVLAGDLGGTKTILMIAECDGVRVQPLHERRFQSNAYPDLGPMLAEFRESAGADARTVERACIGVAGPVTDVPGGQHSRITNLPWEVDSRHLAGMLGIEGARLINDFEAVGHGIAALEPGDFVTLQEGRPQAGSAAALIGAGTGLGQAILTWCGERRVVLPTEGGHADFGPQDEEQAGLWRYLRGELPRVSWEHVVSGAGLVRIYRYLRERGAAPEDADVRDALTGPEPAAVISEAALERNDPLARRALDLFVTLYGSQAGNLALTALARGGVYVAGGIAGHVLPALKEGRFLRAFRDKPPMERLVAEMPVRVIRNARVGLLGAALAAANR